MYSYLGLDCIIITLSSDISTNVHQMAEDLHIVSKMRRSLNLPLETQDCLSLASDEPHVCF